MNLSKEEKEERLIKTCIKLHGAYFTFKPLEYGTTNIYSIERVNYGCDLKIKVNGVVVGQYRYSNIERAVYRFMELFNS